jgi:oligopeptide transport system permease protein
MAEGAVLPIETVTGPITGRSLWAEARGRLVRNRAALTSIIVLGLIALACIFGPFFTGHPFDRVYPDYVKVPASIEAYPKADQVEPSIERIGARVRAKAENITIDNDVVHLTLVSSSARPIDERLLAYFERSDLFGPARVVEKQQEGQRLVVDVPMKRQHFLFGTDTNGRDLLTRTMKAGQVSLAIGLLATFVAIPSA